MEAAMQWGIALILQIQAHRTPMLDDFFRQITTLGSTAHMFIVPFLIWSLSYRFGSRLLITLLLSTFVNFALKDLWSQPRPFDLDSRIGPDREIGYGIPSGHAQHTMVEWGLIANWIANPWFTALAVILIVLIGLSRIYLGVHFPTDVLAGWALAGLILLLHIRYAERVATRLATLALGVQIAAVAAVSLLFVLVYALALDDRFLIAVAGLFFGAGSGIALCRRYLVAPEGGTWWQRLLRYVLGIAVLLTWISQSGKWVPIAHDTSYFVILYLVNMVGGLWLTAGAPALFQVTRLVPHPSTRS